MKKHQESPLIAKPGMTAPSAWIVTDGKAGDEMQCIAVAEALGLAFELRRVAPRAPWSWAMPRGPVDPREAPDRPQSPIAPPFPDIAIASGRRAVAYLKRIRRDSHGQTFTVFLKDPRTGVKAADFIWVQAHDALRGDNVLATPGGPHRHSAERLADARENPWPQIAALGHPRVAVLVGGDSRNHHYRPEDIARFADGLRDFIAEDAHLMMTTSRRTPQALSEALREIAAHGPHLLWDGTGENPLLQYLANADAVVVTADSANMVGEALATGRAVHVFHPHGGHRKFDAFMAGLVGTNAVHPFPGPLKVTTYDPVDSTPEIAEAIRRRFEAHRTARAPAPRG
jgi:mitochondrial fission protein ELM1